MKSLRLVFFLFSFFLFLIMSSCSEDSDNATKESDRPYHPWVFRSVLDQNPRILTLALNDKMWVAYRTHIGGLYKAWRGEVLFDGPVYTNNHGPQPMSIGDAYVQNEDATVWKLLDTNGNEISSIFNYLGHKIVKGKAILMYELVDVQSKASIKIE